MLLLSNFLQCRWVLYVHSIENVPLSVWINLRMLCESMHFHFMWKKRVYRIVCLLVFCKIYLTYKCSAEAPSHAPTMITDTYKLRNGFFILSQLLFAVYFLKCKTTAAFAARSMDLCNARFHQSNILRRPSDSSKSYVFLLERRMCGIAAVVQEVGIEPAVCCFWGIVPMHQATTSLGLHWIWQMGAIFAERTLHPPTTNWSNETMLFRPHLIENEVTALPAQSIKTCFIFYC